jgi:heterodisulfide reductase subunit A
MGEAILVVGGGVAGISASLCIARLGVPAVLVENEGMLGGFAGQFCCKATDSCAYCGACVADELVREVAEVPLIDVRTNTTVRTALRKAQDFEIVLSGAGGGSVMACAVVVATGFAPFDGKNRAGATALTQSPDIVTGLEVERMLRQEGRVLRPSNGKEPGRVAFIQCVGSRSRRFGSPECSRVCCPYAIRLARRIRHQLPGCGITVFHMDLQGIRKVAVDLYGRFGEEIEFTRGIPSEVVRDSSDALAVRYEDTSSGRIKREKYDLVVLSVGIEPRADAGEVAGIFGLSRAAGGFFETDGAAGLSAGGAGGVFLAGACAGPKDIRGSIAQGKAAGHAAAQRAREKTPR